MTDRRSERGEGRIGLIVALAVLGAAIFVGMKVIPVRVNAYEFRDFVREQARFASNTQNDEIRKLVLQKAQQLEIPLDKKNLRVARTQGEVSISAKFEIPIDLKVTTYVYKFEANEKAPLF
jgi:hypothetical protein